MQFTLSIDCDGEAFTESAEDEIGRILRRLGSKIELRGAMLGETWALMDINGNTVGRATLEAS